MFFESTPVDRFEELGGLDAEIARLQRVVRFRLQDEQLAARYKLKDKRGILLEGPLGNGKTKLARGTVFDSASSTIATGRRACGLACPIRAPGAAPPARNCCSAARRRGPVANLDAASDCDRPRFAVRLQALDIHYHELGGLNDRLHAAGQTRDVVLSAATWSAPRVNRRPEAAPRAVPSSAPWQARTAGSPTDNISGTSRPAAVSTCAIRSPPRGRLCICPFRRTKRTTTAPPTCWNC